MINWRYLPIHFSFSLVLGILLGHTFNLPNTLVLIFGLISLLLLIFLKRNSKTSFSPPGLFVIFSFILFIIIGILNRNLLKPENQNNHYSNLLGSKQKVVLRIDKILKSGKYYNRFEAEILQINQIKTKGRILLNIYKDSLTKKFTIDKVLLTNNNFKEVRGAINPYEFDYQRYLKQKNIHHQLILKKDDFFLLNDNSKTLHGIAYQIRERIDQSLKKHKFSKDVLAIINALILGQRQDISKKQFEQYKNAGAIHILAVSGLHIGIILLFLNFLFQPVEKLRNGKLVKLICIVICLWMYAFLAGMSASVVRAVTMFSAITIGLASNRQFSVNNSLVVSFFFLLLINPLFLFDVGFQLSYMAVFSIIWLQPIFKKLWEPKWKIVNYFWQLLTVSFAAQLGILPLSLYYFHQFPGLFFVSSLVILPLLGFILGMGLLIIILAVLGFLPIFLANLYELVIIAMNEFIAFISQKESFIFQNISFSFLLLIAFYILIISGINLLQNKSIKNQYILLIAVIAVQGCLLYEKYEIQHSKEFIVFHQLKKSIIGFRKGTKMNIYQNIDSLNKNLYSPINSYKLKYKDLKINLNVTNKNVFRFNTTNVLIIDKHGIYDSIKFNPETIILIQSPKINVERMIKKLNPRMIIADGSNYKSYVNVWERSCKKNSVLFHNTSKNGAFTYAF